MTIIRLRASRSIVVNMSVLPVIYQINEKCLPVREAPVRFAVRRLPNRNRLLVAKEDKKLDDADNNRVGWVARHVFHPTTSGYSGDIGCNPIIDLGRVSSPLARL